MERSAWKAECHRLESHPRQLFFFSGKKRVVFGCRCLHLPCLHNWIIHVHVHAQGMCLVPVVRVVIPLVTNTVFPPSLSPSPSVPLLPHQLHTPHLLRLQQRSWLIHWSLFVFFNHPKGQDDIIELFLYKTE